MIMDPREMRVILDQPRKDLIFGRSLYSTIVCYFFPFRLYFIFFLIISVDLNYFLSFLCNNSIRSPNQTTQ